MKRLKTNRLVFSAAIAALYTALTVSLAPISFGSLQLRVSEVLCILPFFFPAAVPGLFIGCLLANIISPFGPLDMIFGSAATLLAALFTMLLGKEDAGTGRKLLACLPPVLCNAIMIGAVIAISGGEGESFLPLFVINALEVGLGEAVVMYAIGFPLLLWLPKLKFFQSLMERFK